MKQQRQFTKYTWLTTSALFSQGFVRLTFKVMKINEEVAEYIIWNAGKNLLENVR